MSGIFEQAVRDEAALRAALAEADISPLLMVLVQLTGDMAILDEVAPHVHGAWSFLESVPEELKQKVRDLTHRTSQQKPRDVLIRLNQIMRGWATYFRHAVCKHTLESLENVVWRRVVRWWRSRSPAGTRGGHRLTGRSFSAS